jgi:poly-gamma-glutamate synthesis protein (capsule biosynthesis protein)
MVVSGGDGIGDGVPRPSNASMDGNGGEVPGGGANSGNENGNDGVAGESEVPAVTDEEIASTPTPQDSEGTGNGENNNGEGNVIVGNTGDAVTMSFVGDMLPGEYLNPLMKQNGFDYPYRNALLYLSEPDITAGNLELPVTLGGTPIEGTPYVYKGHPEALPAIKDAGFDVLSLANNHAMDQGVEGMLDTIKHLKEAGIGYMGTGNNDKEAFEPYYMEAKGIKVAFVGLSHVIPYTELKADRNTAGIAETYETKRAAAAISAAKEKADLVVVMVHWGKDLADRPSDIHKENARIYIDAGADLVIGAHPHVLQGFEKYKGKWIAYSLGNFIFSAYPEGTDAETGVLDASCTKDGDCSLKFNPMLVVQGQPTPLEGDAAKALLDRLTSISFGAKLGQDGSIAAP